MDHGGRSATARSSVIAASDAPVSQQQEPAASVTIHRSTKGLPLATTTGAVVVICGKNDSDVASQQQYQPQTAAVITATEHVAFVGGSNTTSAFFLAVLAPSADAALQFLANRPAGAHVLVKDEDENLAVYVKFRHAVRAIVLVKAKELRKQSDAIVWGRPYKSPPLERSFSHSAALLPQTHSTMLTPVHRLYLAAESYTSLEQCWKRFLPQVKAILLQMCCEPYLDEDIKLDDWGAVINTAQTPCIVALTAHSCGFYLIGTTSGHVASVVSTVGSTTSSTTSNSSNSSSAVPVRHVELDFQRHVIVVADGTFNPSAFIVSTHFASKKLFDADITFKTLRDNFLAPDRVMIKETTVATQHTTTAMWPHCVELNASDPELTLLDALQRVCWRITPHEPLPSGLLDALRSLHLSFTESYSLDRCRSERTSSSAAAAIAASVTWSKDKIRMAAQIFPYLLELLVAAASGLETIEAAATSGSDYNVHRLNGSSNAALLCPEPKRKLLHAFARVVRFDIVHMVTRSDDAMVYKFAHHIFQFYAMRCDLPAEFIELVRDLLVCAPEFRTLFLKHQGAPLLWKALHTGDRFLLGSPTHPITGIAPLAHVLMHATALAAKPKAAAAANRRSSLFTLGKKTSTPSHPTARSRKSIDFGTTFAIPVVSSVKPLVFLRVNPLLVQTELLTTLRCGFLDVPRDKLEANSVGSTYAFCFCFERSSTESSLAATTPTAQRTGIYSACKRKKRCKLSPKMCMYELVQQLALEFLFSASSTKTWDRDVGLLLRLENIHGSLTNDVLQQLRDAVVTIPQGDVVLDPDDVLREPDSYCRMRVVIDCVANLYRLELKRRTLAKVAAALGDKKYWYLIHLFRSELRDLNEHLNRSAGSDDNDEDNTGNNTDAVSDGDCHSSADDKVSDTVDLDATVTIRVELLAHIAMFRYVPQALVNEWLVLSLEDLLQTANCLSKLLDASDTTTSRAHVQYACQLLQIFELLMTRSSDADVQTLLVRVLNHGCYALTMLLRQLANVAQTSVDDDDVSTTTSYRIQTTILGFLRAFVALDVALPTKNRWTAQRSSDALASTTKSDDVDALEQRKGTLMANVLLTSGSIGTDEPSLWDFMVLMLVQTECRSPQLERQTTWPAVPTLSVVRAFTQRLAPPELTVRSLAYVRLVEAYLLLTAQFYASIVPDGAVAQADFGPCVANHMHFVRLYSNRYEDPNADDSPVLVCQVTAMHLKCLVALATRRALVPSVITAAFEASHVVATLFELVLDTDRQPTEASSPSVEPLNENTDTTASLRLNLNHVQKTGARLDVQQPQRSAAPPRCLLRTPELHALAIVLIATLVIVEPSLELDDALCPRFAITSDARHSSGSNSACSDLLWTLQQHLATMPFCAASFESVMRDLEATYVIPTAARVSAIRSLVRLVVPSLYDRAIYVTPSSSLALTATTVAAAIGQTDVTTSNEPTDGAVVSEPTEPLVYVAKGAFATVYCSTPMLPHAHVVAVKVLAHQARPGDRSVLKSLYHEVVILKRLQSEPAATQLLDYGNNSAAQSFEVLMEYCPCTLLQWRATLGNAPLRSLLVAVLRAFEYTCQALAVIHCEGVGHFDVKGDNVLIRTTPHDVTRRLLLYEERESFESEAVRFLKTCFCFGDFGESMVAEADRSATQSTSTSELAASGPVALPTSASSPCFYLSRTRGTEAIKSPEMLRISGSSNANDRVTFTSDLWSMGCLFYELITQELLFGNDDAAALYTHVAIGTGNVLRADHAATLRTVLAPRDEPEELLVRRVIVVCEKLLVRDATQRLSIDAMLVEVRRLLDDTLALTKSADDKKLLEVVFATNGDSSDAQQRALVGASHLYDLPSYSDRERSTAEHSSSAVDSNTTLQPAPRLRVDTSRLFWNLHIGSIHSNAASSRASPLQTLTRAGAGDRATSATTALMDAIEAAYADAFDTFVYFLWDADANARFDTDVTAHTPSLSSPSSSLVNEVSEESGRTCLFLNADWLTLRCYSSSSNSIATDACQQQRRVDLDMKFFRQVDLDAHQIFPVFQRLLRSEPGRVLLLGVGRDASALDVMRDVVVSTLLFFLQSAFALDTTDVLALLARDCSQLVGFPRTARLLEFATYAAHHDELVRRVVVREKVTNRRYVARCLCGDSAFAVPVDAIKEAMYHQRQQCSRSAIQHNSRNSNSSSVAACACFHPFPPPAVRGYTTEQLNDQLDGAMRDTYDAREERLMFPLEMQSRRGDQVDWAEVDISAVERLDSLFGVDDASNSSSSSNVNSTAGPAATTTSLSSRSAAPLSARSAAPLIVSFRELRRRRRRQPDDPIAQLTGVGEHSDPVANRHRSAVCALTLGLKERAYGAVQPHSVSTLARSTTAAAATTAKPRKLFACELCCFPICAISSDHDKVALPLYLGR